MGFKDQIAANESGETPVIVEETPIGKAVDEIAKVEPEIDPETGEPVVVDEWLKTAANEDEDEDKPKYEKSLKAKKRLKSLLSESDKEKEQLRLENEQLKARSLEAPEKSQSKRPIREDFKDEYGDIDLEKYRVAIDKFEDDRFEKRQAEKKAATSQAESQRVISEEVEAHNARVTELVSISGISEEVYDAAEIKFRKVIEGVAPGKGDEIADLFIARLGAGSEKVVYFVGQKDAAREKANALLRKDPSGLSLMAFLGEEKQRLKTNTPAKQVSKARAPATQIKSDAPRGPAGKMQREYNKASSSGDVGKAIKLKRQAKLEKVDTSGW